MRDGRVLQMDFDAFVGRLPEGNHGFQEQIHDPEVFIDQDIAVVWAPYTFLINGTPDHEGTDIIHLVRKDGRWWIASIGDNSRKIKTE